MCTKAISCVVHIKSLFYECVYANCTVYKHSTLFSRFYFIFHLMFHPCLISPPFHSFTVTPRHTHKIEMLFFFVRTKVQMAMAVKHIASICQRSLSLCRSRTLCSFYIFGSLSLYFYHCLMCCRPH